MRPILLSTCIHSLQNQLFERATFLRRILQQTKWQKCHYPCNFFVLLLPLQFLLLLMMLLVLTAGGAAAAADGPPPLPSSAERSSQRSPPTEASSTPQSGEGPSEDQSLEVPLFINESRMFISPFSVSTSASKSLSTVPPISLSLLSSFQLKPFELVHPQKVTMSPIYKSIITIAKAPVAVRSFEKDFAERRYRVEVPNRRGRRWQVRTHQRHFIDGHVRNRIEKTKWRLPKVTLTPRNALSLTTSTDPKIATINFTTTATTSSHFVTDNNDVDFNYNRQLPLPLAPPPMLLLPTMTVLRTAAMLLRDEDIGDDSNDRNTIIDKNADDSIDNEYEKVLDAAVSKKNLKRNEHKPNKENQDHDMKTKAGITRMVRLRKNRIIQTSFVPQTLRSSHLRFYSKQLRHQQYQVPHLTGLSRFHFGNDIHTDDEKGKNQKGGAATSAAKSSFKDTINNNATVYSPQDNNFLARFRKSAQGKRRLETPGWTGQVLHTKLHRLPQQVRVLQVSANTLIRKQSSSNNSSIIANSDADYKSLQPMTRRSSKRKEAYYLGPQRGGSDGVWSRVVLPRHKGSTAVGTTSALLQQTNIALATRGALKRHNCSMLLDKGYLPTGAETFAVLGRWGVLLCCMETGMVLVTLAVFSRECLYLYHKWPPRAALLSCAALSVFPFTAICALSAAIFPHMYDVASALVMLYLPFSLVMYYELVATYAGGCQMLWELLADQRMPLKGPPLCCVLPPCCGPGPILTRKRQRLMRYFIYQLLAVPVLLVGVIFVCTLAGVHPGDRLEATNASPYLMVIQALSFVLGTYALVICVKLAARHLPQHALRRKFTVFHLHYTITRLQVIFFKLTGLTASLPCIPPLSSMASGIYMSCAMLIGQCFLMSTVSQYFFLHTPPVAFLGPPSELMAYEAGADKHSKRGGRTERWLLPHRRSGCRSALQQNSVPVAAGCLGATPPVSVRPNAIDYTNETFSSEPSDPGAEGPAGLGLVMGSTLQPPPPLGLSCLMASSNNQNNNNINNNNNHHRINSNNHLGVTRRVNAHAPLTRALSHPVAGAPGAAPPSLSIGTLRRVPFSVPNPVNSPQCGAPASRAKLTLDLKTTHTITLDRKWRRRQVLTRCSSASSLEDELDLKVSTMAEATTVRRREHELVAARKRSPQVDAEDQQLRHRGRNTADLCNSLVTCSLDEALRIREVRERRARLWRVSVAGGERWASLASQGPPWPVTSLEETHHFDMNDHSDANAWINEVSQRWLRKLPDWELTSSSASPTLRLAPIDFMTRRPDLTVSSAGWTRSSPVSGNEQFC